MLYRTILQILQSIKKNVCGPYYETKVDTMEDEKIITFALCNVEKNNRGYVESKSKTLKSIKEAMERVIILEVLLRSDWNITCASKELGVSRWTLRSKIKKYHIVRRI
jgi:transcriptional regulator with PAS, ATPase and Fis domain